MPTVLNYLGYDKPYISFGIDLFNNPEGKDFAVNYINGVYQYVNDGLLLQHDGTKAIGVYDITTDRLLRNNLLGTRPEQSTMEHKLQAIIQSYMQRMNTDNLVVKE